MAAVCGSFIVDERRTRRVSGYLLVALCHCFQRQRVASLLRSVRRAITLERFTVSGRYTQTERWGVRGDDGVCVCVCESKCVGKGVACTW